MVFSVWRRIYTQGSMTRHSSPPLWHMPTETLDPVQTLLELQTAQQDPTDSLTSAITPRYPVNPLLTGEPAVTATSQLPRLLWPDP
jgi:hypothetical protein